MTEIWRDILKNTEKNEAERKSFRLPAIVLIVLYNGKHNWTASLEFKDVIANYAIFQDQLLNFNYILLDVNRYKRNELLEISNLISAIFFLDQDMEVQDELIDRLNSLVRILSNLSDEEYTLFKAWMKRIFKRRLPKEQHTIFEEIIDKTKREEAVIMVSNLEENLKKFEEQAIERGIEKGQKDGEFRKAIEIARKMVQKGMSIEEIIELTGLSYDEIMQFKLH